eukprot:823091_1
MHSKKPESAKQYAELCQFINDYVSGQYSSKRWIIETADINVQVRKMVIKQANVLFTTHVHNPDPVDDDADTANASLFAVMVLLAELYNIGIINRNLVMRGIMEGLLPPNNENFTSQQLEGLCCFLKHCGKKFDREAGKFVDEYVKKIAIHCACKFDSQKAVIELKEFRINGWKFPEIMIYKGKCKAFYPLEGYGFITANDESGIHGDV